MGCYVLPANLDWIDRHAGECVRVFRFRVPQAATRAEQYFRRLAKRR